MGYSVYKNDVISSDAFTDLAGTEQYRAYKGERRLGLDFETGLNLADENEVLSYDIWCDVCGEPVKSKKELVKVDGWWRCKDCIDEV
jgi:hypothetical protein